MNALFMVLLMAAWFNHNDQSTFNERRILLLFSINHDARYKCDKIFLSLWYLPRGAVAYLSRARVCGGGEVHY